MPNHWHWNGLKRVSTVRSAPESLSHVQSIAPTGERLATNGIQLVEFPGGGLALLSKCSEKTDVCGRKRAYRSVPQEEMVRPKHPVGSPPIQCREQTASPPGQCEIRIRQYQLTVPATCPTTSISREYHERSTDQCTWLTKPATSATHVSTFDVWEKLDACPQEHRIERNTASVQDGETPPIAL